MKNSEHSDDENDLTKLSLWFGSSKRAKHSPPITSPQTNISLTEETHRVYPNPNPSLLPSTDHTSNLVSCGPFRHIYQPIASGTNSVSATVTRADPDDFSHTNPLALLPSSENMNPQNAGDVGGNVPTPTTSMRRTRRAPSKGVAKGKSKIIPAPFPWAMNRRATVHSLDYLLKNNIRIITGNVQCKRCEKEFELRVDLEEKVGRLREFIESERDSMHDRAPGVWVNPELAKCTQCGTENSAKPILGDTKKKAINWLFLLLTQMLGCCTLNQLKYFCKHTNNHRTGAKDRLLYLTYMTLCNQLLPRWFH
ncbi:hypothetical protein Fmac_017377 [Flemingia macrophylla]|uniref:DUF7086 domain-containing protein n=1 Tax=Flemingia macrophylla TaxID=520843 RepID=A0ABD1M244_9FABA